MASTSWQAAPWMSKQKYLLKDGTVVLSPDVEVTTSGRRVRVTGTEESIGKNQYQELIERSVDAVAMARGTTRWLRLPTDEEELTAHSLAGPGPTNVNITTRTPLHLTNTERNGSSTTAVFEYQAVGIAELKAYVWVHLETNHYGQTVHVTLTYRNLHPRQTDPRYGTFNGEAESWEAIPNSNRYESDFAQLQKLIHNTQPFGEYKPFGKEAFGSQPRSAVVKFLEVCKHLLDLDTLVIPDTRNPEHLLDPTAGYLNGDVDAPTLEFKFTRTNYTANLKRELLDFVQAGPALTRVQEHYNGLIQAFRDLGIVPSDILDEAALDKALSAGPAGVKVTLAANEDRDEAMNARMVGIDRSHSVVLDLVTGSVVVTCTHKNEGEIAESWNVALFKAEMAGQTDTLLEYARAYNNPKEQARLRKILKQRNVPNVTE